MPALPSLARPRPVRSCPACAALSGPARSGAAMPALPSQVASWQGKPHLPCTSRDDASRVVPGPAPPAMHSPSRASPSGVLSRLPFEPCLASTIPGGPCLPVSRQAKAGRCSSGHAGPRLPCMPGPSLPCLARPCLIRSSLPCTRLAESHLVRGRLVSPAKVLSNQASPGQAKPRRACAAMPYSRQASSGQASPIPVCPALAATSQASPCRAVPAVHPPSRVGSCLVAPRLQRCLFSAGD
jgi:hypothetical protein